MKKSIHQKRQYKKWFTLLEMLISLVVFGIIFGVLFSLFLRIIRQKTEIEARQTLIKTTYDIIEDINKKIQNYSIDYEEYFNRSMVGCVLTLDGWANFTQWPYFVWNVWSWSTWGAHCNSWTAYGNESPYLPTHGNHVSANTQHKLYTCSSDPSLTYGNVYGTTSWPLQEERLLVSYNVGDLGCNQLLFDAYSPTVEFDAYFFRQPYGEYKTQFLDVKSDVDDNPGRSWDDDDTNNWLWPTAIYDNQNVKELYMISKDERKRILFRRKLVATGDWNNNGIIDSDAERQYTIQMLQLKSFDAWQNHDFDAATYKWVYDGVVDTWACDAEAGFTCTWPALWATYPWYNLPANADDGWVNLITNDVSVTDWNMQIFPVKDPEYSRWEWVYQVNPYIRLYIKTWIYGENRIGRIWAQNMDQVMFDTQVMINTRSNY